MCIVMKAKKKKDILVKHHAELLVASAEEFRAESRPGIEAKRGQFRCVLHCHILLTSTCATNLLSEHCLMVRYLYSI